LTDNGGCGDPTSYLCTNLEGATPNCATLCSADNECPAGTFGCDPQAGTCIEPSVVSCVGLALADSCQVNALPGACIEGENQDLICGPACDVPEDCDENEAVCHALGQGAAAVCGAPCASDADCPASGTVCDVSTGICAAPAATVDLTGWKVQVFQNGNTAGELKFEYTFSGTYEIGSYVVVARDAADVATWSGHFTPTLTSEETENIALLLDTGNSWQMNGSDDPVHLVAPDGSVQDIGTPEANKHNHRLADGSWLANLATNGAQGALPSITGVTAPVYIYEIGEKGSSTRLTAFEGNYVILYISGN